MNVSSQLFFLAFFFFCLARAAAGRPLPSDRRFRQLQLQLQRKQQLRTSDGGMETSLAESAPAEWVTTLPVLEADGDSLMTNAE